MTVHVDICFKRKNAEINETFNSKDDFCNEYNFVAENGNNEFEVIRKWFEENNLHRITLKTDSDLEKRICAELARRVVIKAREKSDKFPYDILQSYNSGLGKIYGIFSTIYDFSILGWRIEMRCYW